MTTSSNSATPPTSSKGLGYVVLISILLQLFSRYAPAPVSDFASDSWGFLHLAQQTPTYADAAKLFTAEPDRPIQAAVLTSTFKALGDNLHAYAMLSMLGYSVLIALGVCLAFELTSSLLIAALFGITFSAWPNLTESFHWRAMIAVVYMQIAYVGSALAWVRYIKSDRWPWLALSCICFAIGLGSYEFGIGLPIVYLCLSGKRGLRATLVRALPLFCVIGFYLAWRLTRGFGMADGVLFSPRQPFLSLWTVLWSAKEVASWWIGSHMGNAIRQGLNGFSIIAQPISFALAIGNIIVAILLAVFLTRRQAGERDTLTRATPFPLVHVILFALLWIASGHALNLVSWTASRLNLFPAVGVSLFAACCLGALRSPKWISGFAVLLMLALTSNQGTTQHWVGAGTFQRNLFEHIAKTKSEWDGKAIVYFDTTRVRHRLTTGLLAPVSHDPSAWAHYGGAGLLRGFVPNAMLQMAKGSRDIPIPVLDTECGGVIGQETIQWHARYNPDDPRETAREDAFIVDCFSAGIGRR